MDGTAERQALLRQEAMIAIVVNALISIAFFLVVFGWQTVSARDLAIDFLPQSAGVTFLGTLIPSLIIYRRIARGAILPAGSVPSKGRHLLRIVGVAIIAVVVCGGTAAVLTWWLAPTALAPLPALIVKAAYGAVLGWLVTPPILRAVLGMPMFGPEPAMLAQAA